MWVGTKQGAIRYFVNSTTRNSYHDPKYYFGPRWLPIFDPTTPFDDSQNVTSVTYFPTAPVTEPEAAVIATLAGISIITFKKWNLQKKADFFNSEMWIFFFFNFNLSQFLFDLLCCVTLQVLAFFLFCHCAECDITLYFF